jgi:hypothetical protein
VVFFRASRDYALGLIYVAAGVLGTGVAIFGSAAGFSVPCGD